MSKFQIVQKKRKILTILCLVVIIKLVDTACPYPYQRCICSGSTPLCQCSWITSTQTLNTSSSYYSHLVLVGNYGCRPCPPRCRKCSSTQVCSECFDQFELISNYCVPCPINCKKCKLGVCQSCIDGYYIDYKQKCQKCPLMGTKTCTIDSLLSCSSNYWLDNNGATCVNCDVNCKVCSSTSKCSSCIDGYYEMNYVCYKCRNDCALCTNDSSCVTCLSSNFYFNSTLGACTQCPDSNCISCNSNGTCTQCDALKSYYLDKTTKLCYIYSNQTQIQNCKNLTFTTSNNSYSCQNCQDGFYSLSDFNSASVLTCYYGCSIACNKCTGPHHGLCDQCVSEANFNLLNRHCIPKFNINDGSAFQLLYTALNNVSFFQAPTLISPDSCWHEYVKGGSSTIVLRLSRMSVYKITLKWKVYKYNFYNSSQADGIYSLQINNTLIQNEKLSQGYSFISFNCVNKIGFSSLCTSGSSYQCTDKNFIDFDSLITATDNVFTFSSTNSQLAMSELLVIGYRCGGVYGEGCIQCIDINTCTRCENPSFYLIAQKCISQCPNTYYTYQQLKKCVQICPSGSYSEDVLHQCFSCQSPCETCTSSTQCLTCRQGYYYDELSGQCTTQCPKRYYKDSYRRICEKCSKPCFQCLDSVQCISCREGFLNLLNETYQSNKNSIIQYGQCVLQCPDRMYTDLLTMKCQQCLSPCKSCSLLADQCTSCLIGFYLLDYNCLAQCPLGYYQNQTLLKCIRCDSSCKNCHNPTFCVECQVGFYLSADNTCVTSCSVGYYQEEVLKKCIKCKQNCFSCNSYNICTSCASNFSYLEDNYSCIVSCPKFYYSVIVDLNDSLSQSSICQRCQLPCYQCSSQHTCLSCYDAFLFNGSCLIACPSGYFANLATLQCLQCDNNFCLQCKNTPTQCTKCNQDLLLVNGKCLEQCPYGFYFSSYKSQCVLCQGLCDTCLNSTYCLTCIEGFSLLKQGQCVNSCQTGFYQQHNGLSGGFTCIQCPQECQACIYNNTLQSVQCFLCNSRYSFYNGSCLMKCPDGYYDNSGQCLLCVSPCSKCQNQEYCLECLDGYGFLFQGTCLTVCPYGYYSNENQCLQCDSSCLLCADSSTNCLACNDGFYMYSFYLNNFTKSKSVCSVLCPEGYFRDQSSSDYDNLCQKCSVNCGSCAVSADKCLSCDQGKILYDGKCVLQCPIGTYFNQISKTCILCDYNCLYCLNNMTCIQCQGQYYLTSNNSCKKLCSSSQYGQDGVCKPCVYPCESCINQNECLSCIVGIYYVNENSCMDRCPQGSFYVKQNNTQLCKACRQNCSRCVSQNECLFCDNGLSLYAGFCVQNCPDGYYGNYGYCVKCDQNCMICLNSYTCFDCKNGAYLFNNKCIPYCPSGYFPLHITLNQSSSNTSLTNTNTTVKIQSICQHCAAQCTKCYNSPTKCTQCAQGYYLYINTCLLLCPSGSYSSPTLKKCQPCVSPCQTCTNSYSCQSCIYGYLLYREYSKNQCVQGPSCPNNYYLNTNLKICEFICPQIYYVSESTRTCSLSCSNNLVTLAQNMSCLEQCPQKMWINQNLQCKGQQSKPQNLPQLSCSPFTLRNSLFLSCIISNNVVNIQSLKAQNIEVSVGQVSLVKVKSNSQFYLLISGIEKILKSQKITLQLINRYEVRSSFSINLVSNKLTMKSSQQLEIKTSVQDSNQQQYRISSSQSILLYPVQNYKTQILIAEHIPYSISQRQIGLSFYQIGQSMSYAGLIIWLFSLLKNVKIVSLTLLINMQWLYSLSMLLSGNFLAPNVNKFLQGFKYSALIDVINTWSSGSYQQSIWTVDNFSKPQYWAINNLYSIQESLITVYIIISIFLFIFFLTLTLSKTLSESFISPQYQTLLKVGKKSQLINERFYSNYFFHILLLTILPISLMLNIQLLQPNVKGLVQIIILFLSYLAFIIITVYFFIKWKAQNIKKNTLKSIMFFYITFGTIILDSIFVIWSTFYLYVGFSVASIILNIIVWHIIYKHTESKRCAYLQLIELFKGFILIVLIIGDIKRQKWSQDQMFYFGFVQIVTIFLYILLSSVFIAQQLFRPQHSSIKKQQKALQQSLLKQKSYKISNFPKHYSQRKDHQKQPQQGNSQQIINQEDQQQELSFFSNRTPQQQSEDESSGDIIDFDESQEQNKQFQINNFKIPPKNLFKYDKNA